MRPTLTDDCLNSSMPMSCEKDLTDAIDFTSIAGCWANLKSRRIQPVRKCNPNTLFKLLCLFNYLSEHEPIECGHTSIMKTQCLLQE